jgi:hypothetical protein
MEQLPKLPDPPKTMLWFDGEQQAIVDRLQDGPVLLLGGRGTSKTAVLSCLAETHLRDAWYVPGRNYREARRMLADHTRHTTVLIDDLDALLTANISDKLRDLQDLLGDLWWHLKNQAEGAEGKRPRFLVTASIEFQGPRAYHIEASLDDPDDRIRWRDNYSQFAQGLHRHALNPWEFGWDQWWNEEYVGVFGTDRLRTDLAELWRRVIFDLTGGHPALFGPAVDRLDYLCANPGRLSVPEQPLVGLNAQTEDRDNDGLELEIRRYLENLLEPESVRRIRSAIRRLKDSQEVNERAAYTILLRIARENKPSGYPPPEEIPVRRILLEEALAFEDARNWNFRIPGSRIRELILESAPLVEPVFSLIDDGDEGGFRILSSSGEDRVELTGAAWQVFKELYRRKGELASAAQLKDAAGLPDDKRAVTNAIQRILGKLKPYGLGHIIDNEYKKGYRLVIRP